LLVGEREGFAGAEVEVRLRLPPGTSDELVEERVARAASEVVTHLEIGSRVGLRSKLYFIPPATGPAQRAELLCFLARVMSDPTEAANAIHANTPHAREDTA
jgi:uncharacterized protein (DUF58 family)